LQSLLDEESPPPWVSRFLADAAGGARSQAPKKIGRARAAFPASWRPQSLRERETMYCEICTLVAWLAALLGGIVLTCVGKSVGMGSVMASGIVLIVVAFVLPVFATCVAPHIEDCVSIHAWHRQHRLRMNRVAPLPTTVSRAQQTEAPDAPEAWTAPTAPPHTAAPDDATAIVLYVAPPAPAAAADAPVVVHHHHHVHNVAVYGTYVRNGMDVLHHHHTTTADALHTTTNTMHTTDALVRVY
jgi:hypothetical protein